MAQKKILIVEDDAYIRDVYEEVLKDAGYSVITAPDGEAGLTKILSDDFSLILLDIMMPKLDGIGVLKQLKEKKGGKKIDSPILLLTNLVHDPVINEGLSLGAKSYLNKSDLDPGKLVEHVKSLLG